jgi:hypothetical protein
MLALLPIRLSGAVSRHEEDAALGLLGLALVWTNLTW